MTTPQDRLNQILPSWYDLLTQWSLDGSLVAAASDALMLESSNAKQDAKGQLQAYASQWSAGNFQNLPQIVLLSAADISGAYGAYADSTDTVYLNQDWLLTASEEEIRKVLTHELGHYLDDQLNNGDTEGDEGAIFSSLLLDKNLADISFKTLQSSNDNILILLGENYIEAQASTPTLSKAWETTFSDTPAGAAGFKVDVDLLVDNINGGVFTVGKTSPYQFAISKISKSGALLWRLDTAVNHSIALYDTLIDDLGGFYVVGSVDDQLNGVSSIDPVGNNVNDGFLISYNSNGSIKWTCLYGSQGEDVVSDIELLPNKNILMKYYRSDTGWSLSEVRASDGALLSTSQFSAAGQILVDNVGSLYSQNGLYGSIISKHNSYTSSVQWQVDLSSIFGPAVIFDLEFTKDGSIVVAGRVNSSTIAVEDQYGFLASISSNGSILWPKPISTKFLNISDIEVDEDTNIYLEASSGLSGGSPYTAAFTKFGLLLWEVNQLFGPNLAPTSFEIDKDLGLYFGTGGVSKYIRDIASIGPATFRINGIETGQESQNLTCSLAILDPDGMTKLPPTNTADPINGYAYQWQVSTDGSVNSWTNATGVGSNTFKYSVNTVSDANKFLRVQVVYTDDKGIVETVYTDQVKIVSGTTKSDKFAGTAGIEVTFSGPGADAVATGAGNDFAKGGIGNDTFTGADGDGDDFFDGQTEIDIINYSASSKGVDIDFVTGLATERTVGGIGKDSFAGIENARGTTGADSFKGSTGVNVFTGSGGADTFNFANAQAFGASTSDRITDMSSDDKIQVSASAFGIVGKTYTFAAVSGTKAVNASAALIVYDTGSGYLYLNKDGGTSGMGGGGIFAVLDNKFAGLAAANVGLI